MKITEITTKKGQYTMKMGPKSRTIRQFHILEIIQGVALKVEYYNENRFI